MYCVMEKDQSNHIDKKVNRRTFPLVKKIQTWTAGILGKVLNKKSYTLVYTYTGKPENPSLQKQKQSSTKKLKGATCPKLM